MSADTGALVPLPGTAVLMMLDPHAVAPGRAETAEPTGPAERTETTGPTGPHAAGPHRRGAPPKALPGTPGAGAPRRLALTRVTRALHVIFGVRGPRALESAAYGRQVRLHAAARRAERAGASPAAPRAAAEVRVLTLHLRPAPAPGAAPADTARTPRRRDGDAPAPGRGAGASEIDGRVEVFGSCRVDGRVHAFVACLDGGRLDVLRVG
ncbi:hypothetical protein [Corynebacterium frankenforstense]|uniref:hypothetical protein n=2 Tax=Corynebacterium TaxID=1716 RepID=UPI0026EAF034|nr:hypothetical protein [Corynebacterium frankenforstense]